MKTVNTNTLKHEALDCAVALALGHRLTTLSQHLSAQATINGLTDQELASHLDGVVDMPCVENSDGPPQRVPLYSLGHAGIDEVLRAAGVRTSPEGLTWNAWIAGRPCRDLHTLGDTSREAALRCLVLQKIGPSVNLPDFMMTSPISETRLAAPAMVRELEPA